MAASTAFHHRSTLKQTNKPFKRRYASKNSLRDKSKGKTQRTPVKGKVQRKHTKADRRNTAKLEQQKKREQLMMTARLFMGRYRVSKLVVVVPLCIDVSTVDIVRGMFECMDQPFEASQRIHTLEAARFKQTLRVIEVERNLTAILDAARIADYIVFGLSAKVEVDAFGELCLTSIQNQGIPSVFTVVQHLDTVPVKRHSGIRKSLSSFIQYFFPDQDKLFTADSQQESLNIVRAITSQVPRQVQWRDTHPYIVADQVEFAPDLSDQNVGRLAITGYLRGMPLSANRLIHIPNYGDFQIEKILSAPAAAEDAKGNDMDTEDIIKVLAEPNPAEQDSLAASNEPDVMMNEQTWPEDEELAGWEAQMKKMEAKEAEAANKTRMLKKVPKGTSAYQANWIVNSESEGESDMDSDMVSDDDEEAREEGEEYEYIELDERGNPIENPDTHAEGGGRVSQDAVELDEADALSNYSEQLPDVDEDKRQLDEYLQRQRDTRDDLEFPDEVDTPLDEPARVRFARYRGLQSFRTSPWDPYENLPLDYARIFQFENFKKTQHRVLSNARDAAVKPGARIQVFLRNVPRDVMDTYHPNALFVCYGLLQYEHQMSVLHFTIQRHADYTKPVRSKDPMVLQYGFRRYLVRPLYSQNTRGGPGTNNVHKFERFLHPGRVSVGTVYAPIQFGTVPVSLFLPTTDSTKGPTLVATGSTLEINPLRILAKRIILTGAPYKIHKRSAVIRYMFFNPEDIAWFKPVQLTTKMGRIGHIRESLGTHGYMKCIFDDQLKQMDTVCMYLYKRVFPKWDTELWRDHGSWVASSTAASNYGDHGDEMVMDMQ
ncbi:ribosome biogenesis protein tsr1 [Spiromyces aspiralis]|uniref:Ribosome biogenesis protein tsr1 n=1 Tax=Spiromyces aspiralis TaxID=68401 RepID=A0ACC1HKH8_9FUNG|nr:ribosome biogenesis protein tsr1 [Spiromyces aspiralis]